ncbi:LamG domain-containing protein [Actinomadura geliboluensis]|uniref:Laminin G domain-containing protein n=1 Tax=Actinomadura geliboluensis TaxID=882440 RepID=A0A5S4FP30_9ACTN|nr:LamG domain-containing protein [Actinomadura geliboluensis]TMR21961.1 hypothetical protein ETD96_44000 [Actinomadura geliboluensis]
MPTSTATPIIDVSGDFRSIQAAVADLSALSGLESGTLLFDVASSIDGPLLAIDGENGSVNLSISGGRLLGEARLGPEVRVLDAEDALGLDDGVVHTLGLTVDGMGTHVHVDGYEAFSTTLGAWFSQIRVCRIVMDPDGIMDVTRLVVWDAPLTPHAVVARSAAVRPFVEFAAAALSARDARRCGELSAGAVRARFRTRGQGQGGVIVAARGSLGVLRLSVESGDLVYCVRIESDVVAQVRAPGRWDDGEWHDICLVSGRGSIDLYVDGYQVVHSPGTAFFSDLGSVDQVLAGMDLDGSRLFGEAQTAMIYGLEPVL